MSDSETDELEAIRERKRRRLAETVADGSDDEGSDADGAGADAPDQPIHVEGEDHLAEVTGRHGVVLVDYFAEWCGPCQMLEPVVETLARETDAAVAKVDIDRHQGLARSEGIRGVPTLSLYADGEPVERLVGMQDESTLRDLIDRYA